MHLLFRSEFLSYFYYCRFHSKVVLSKAFCKKKSRPYPSRMERLEDIEDRSQGRRKRLKNQMQGLAGLPLPAALGQYILNDFVLFVGITIHWNVCWILGLYRTKSILVRNKFGFFFQNPDFPADYSSRALLDMFWMK